MPVAPASRIWASGIGSFGPNQRQACSMPKLLPLPAVGPVAYSDEVNHKVPEKGAGPRDETTVKPRSKLHTAMGRRSLPEGGRVNFVGLDIGTSAAKGILVDERQAVLAEASAPIAGRQPRPGWSEQDPEEWW